MCCVQISLKGNTMVHTQTGEKTATREDLTTEVTRTFDTEVGHSAVLLSFNQTKVREDFTITEKPWG